jgi:hypothetical protein
MLGLRDVQSFCGMHEGESLGVRNLERGNTKLSLKDVPSICSGGADLRGDSVLQLKKGETTCSEDGRVLPTSELPSRTRKVI